MKTWKSFLLALSILAVGSSSVYAKTILWDWAFNVDGDLYPTGASTFGPIDANNFDSVSGIGSLTWSTSDVGSHSFMAAFDHDIDASTNTWWNEEGSTIGSAAAGQSWEIDEPGYWLTYDTDSDGTNDTTGDIYGHLQAGNPFDERIFNGQLTTEDVAMGMGWDFSLAANQEALITLSISDTLTLNDMTDGLYLCQYDPHSNVLLSLTSTLTITTTGDPGPDPIPEPGTILLFGSGLLGIARYTRKIKFSA